MRVLSSFNKGVFLVLVLSVSFLVSFGQNVKPTSVTLNTSNPVSCKGIQYTIGYEWGCVNFQYTGLTYSISGSTIIIDVNFTGGMICQGRISRATNPITLTNVPAGTYSILVRGMLSGTQLGTLTGSQLVVNSCCATKANFNSNSSSFCDGDTLRLTNSSANYSSQNWFKNGTLLDTSKNYKGYISGPGNHAYTLIVSGGACGTDTIVKNVRVLADPELGNDTTLCLGTPLSYSLSKNWNSYNWTDSVSTNTISISKSGSYKVTVTTASSCVREDSVNVNFVGPLLDIGKDTVICSSDSLVIDAGAGTWNSVSWSTGENTPQITASKPGVYVANVENSIGCAFKDSLEISFDKDSILSFSGTDTICSGDSAEITLGNQFAKYLWFDNDTSRIKKLSGAGSFNVTATSDIGCEVQGAKVITALQLPVVDLGNDTALCNDSIYLLSAFRAGIVEYRWQNSSRGSRFEIKKAGQYRVTVTDTNGCQGNDTLIVTYKLCEKEEPVDTTGINGRGAIAKLKYVVYPNPANDVVTIEGIEQAEIQSTRIISMSGETVLERKIDNLQEVELDISSIEFGAYILVIKGKNKFYHFPLIKD